MHLNFIMYHYVFLIEPLAFMIREDEEWYCMIFSSNAPIKRPEHEEELARLDLFLFLEKT